MDSKLQSRPKIRVIRAKGAIHHLQVTVPVKAVIRRHRVMVLVKAVIRRHPAIHKTVDSGSP
ncbi:MAG: hypothetical protein HYR56_23605 [Acidobacteria bacterium]|nr:hypothetical protein [Acidobacteriota bacterium]MBI3423001.1 hypothetical protein [Acidobacteriota bacterium]